MGAVLASSAILAGTLVAAGVSPAGAQKSGGDLRFGLEAESTGGFCLNQAQLVTSGKQVAAAIYDTLTVPNTKNEYVPNLAESVTPNATFNEWTIKLRPNVKFHDGTPLNADALKQNMDGWKTGRLFSFVYSNMDQVTKVDDLTVKVTTKTPWKAFPAYLYLEGRAGIMAPAQMNNAATCATNMIGTGPSSSTHLRLEGQRVAEGRRRTPTTGRRTPRARPSRAPTRSRSCRSPTRRRVTRSSSAASSTSCTRRARSRSTSSRPPRAVDVVGRSPATARPATTRSTRQKPPFNNPDARLALGVRDRRQDHQPDPQQGPQHADQPGHGQQVAGLPQEQRVPEVQPEEGPGAGGEGEGGQRRQAST